MSHFPAAYPNELVPALGKFAAYEGRIDVTRQSPSSTTTATFVVPALYGTVQIALSSASSFLAGDKVSIGELYGHVFTATTPTPLTNPLTLRAFRRGSWRDNYLFGLAGLYVKGPSGESTVTTSSYTTPNILTNATTSVSVANPSVLPNNKVCRVTSYAGVYEVVSVDSATLLTVRKIYDGDLTAGDTAPSGVWCSQGTLLGVMPPAIPGSLFPAVGFGQFFACNVLSQVTRLTAGGSANTPAIAVGWGANADSGAATCPYNQFCDGESSGGGTIANATSAVVGNYKFHSMNSTGTSQLNTANRLGVPPGMPLFAYVNTRSTATVYEIMVCVRGFFSEAA